MEKKKLMTQTEFNILYWRKLRWVNFFKKKAMEAVRRRRNGRFSKHDSRILYLRKVTNDDMIRHLLSKTEDMGYFNQPKIYVKL